MDYPFKIELTVEQDDFIAVDILEQQVEKEAAKKDTIKSFKIKMIFSVIVTAVFIFFSFTGKISPFSMIIPSIILISFIVGFFLEYTGIDKEFSFGVSHLLSARDDHTFFTSERGTIEFFEDKCEFLTQEQRRLFNYTLIKHIKITKFLYIFVMKKSKEKQHQGFAYMVIPKRILLDREIARLDRICDDIVKKYNLTPWTESDIMG